MHIRRRSAGTRYVYGMIICYRYVCMILLVAHRRGLGVFLTEHITGLYHMMTRVTGI